MTPEAGRRLRWEAESPDHLSSCTDRIRIIRSGLGRLTHPTICVTIHSFHRGFICLTYGVTSFFTKDMASDCRRIQESPPTHTVGFSDEGMMIRAPSTEMIDESPDGTNVIWYAEAAELRNSSTGRNSIDQKKEATLCLLVRIDVIPPTLCLTRLSVQWEWAIPTFLPLMAMGEKVHHLLRKSFLPCKIIISYYHTLSRGFPKKDRLRTNTS